LVRVMVGVHGSYAGPPWVGCDSTTLTREEFIQMMAQIMVNITAEHWKRQPSTSSVAAAVLESPIPITPIQMLPPPDAPSPRRARRDNDRMTSKRCRAYKARRTTRRAYPPPPKARMTDRWCDFHRQSAHNMKDCRELQRRGEKRHRDDRPRRNRPSSSRKKHVDRGPNPDSDERRTSSTWKILEGPLQGSEEHAVPVDIEEQMELL
ncbi:hypothetical protein Dimus_035553, partial [Dionaea muscipula]